VKREYLEVRTKGTADVASFIFELDGLALPMDIAPMELANVLLPKGPSDVKGSRDKVKAILSDGNIIMDGDEIISARFITIQEYEGMMTDWDINPLHVAPGDWEGGNDYE
jgi:hypothetical protein